MNATFEVTWVHLGWIVASVALLVFAFSRSGRTMLHIVLGGMFLLFASGLFFALFAVRSVHTIEHTMETHAVAQAHDAEVEVYGPSGKRTPAQPARIEVRDKQPEIEVFPSELEQHEPAWLQLKEEIDPQRGYRRTVTSGPCISQPQSMEKLDVALHKAVNEYLVKRFGATAPARLNLSSEFIMEGLVRDLYHRQRDDLSVGDTIETVALVEFPPRTMSMLQDELNQQTVDRRMRQAGTWAAFLFIVMGTCLAYLKYDTATKGYYSGRLKVASAVTILAALAASTAFARNDYELPRERAGGPASYSPNAVWIGPELVNAECGQG